MAGTPGSDRGKERRRRLAGRPPVRPPAVGSKRPKSKPVPSKKDFDTQQTPQKQQAPFEYAAKCRVIRKIADGGMGSVYLAEQIGATGFSKTVALKVIRKDRLSDSSTVAMFVDEAKLVADLVHQNILQVYNLAAYGGRHFIVMEFLHGVTLTDFVKRHAEMGKLCPVDYAAFIASRVCRGLAYAHDKRDRQGRHLGIVHRDVTPSNVMIDFRGFVKLTDFGIAKALETSVPDESEVIMGKLPYMSPEQARGDITGPRSDIFSLGLVLYQILTGETVYRPESRKDLLRLMSEYRIVPPKRLRSSIPDDLDKVVMGALQPDVGKRYQGAKEFVDILEHYMYHDRYGPTNEKLAEYVRSVFPESDRDRIE